MLRKEGEALPQSFIFWSKNVPIWDFKQTGATQAYLKRVHGGMETKPPAAQRFMELFKKGHFNNVWINFHMFLHPFGTIKRLKFKRYR